MNTSISQNTEDYKLHDILGIFERWRMLALVAFLAVLIPGIFVTLLMPPMYEASAQLLVDRSSVSPTYSVKPGSKMEVSSVIRNVNREEEVKTVAEMIRTRALIEKTVTTLNIDFESLNHIRDFRRYVRATINGVIDSVKWVGNELKYVTHLSKRPTPEEQAFAEREKLLDIIGDRLSVTSVPDTNILRATFRASDPVLAQSAINTIIAEFVNSRNRADQVTLKYFTGELRLGTKELHTAEVALAKFRGQMSTYSIITQRDLMLQTEERLRAEIAQTEAQQAQKRAAVNALREQMGKNLQFRQDIKKSLIYAEVELKEATAQLDSLHKSLEENSQLLATTNLANVKLRELERNVESSEEALILRQRNFEQARTTESMNKAQLRNVRVVSLASYPLSPVRPRTLLYLGIALAAAMLAAIALPFVAHLNDTTLGSEHDASYLLGLPLVVSIPLIHDLPAAPRLGSPMAAANRSTLENDTDAS